MVNYKYKTLIDFIYLMLIYLFISKMFVNNSLTYRSKLDNLVALIIFGGLYV